MAFKIADRIRENTTTVGSGVINLVGNNDGFRRFGDVLSSGDTTYYCIEENNKFEIGIGTYYDNSINRDYILQSSQSGNIINLSGSGVIFLTYPANKAVIKDPEDQTIIGPSGIIFNDGSVQFTAATSIGDFNYISGVANYASGSSILNTSEITAVSGWAVNYIDSQDHSAIAVSGWAKNYIDSQDHNAIAVSGWANNTLLSDSSAAFIYVSGIATYSSGQINNNYVNISSNYNISVNNNKIFADCSLSNVNVYIPTASGIGGKSFTIKKIGGDNELNIVPIDTETIDGNSQYNIRYIYESINITSNNINWFIT